MSYGIRVFVDGVACDYTDKPFNLFKVVFVKWFKEGANSITLPTIPSTGSQYVMSEAISWNSWVGEGDVPTNIKLVYEAGGRPEHYTGWKITNINLTGNILTFTAKDVGFSGRFGLLSFDLYVTR